MFEVLEHPRLWEKRAFFLKDFLEIVFGTVRNQKTISRPALFVAQNWLRHISRIEIENTPELAG
jgi:hypothetical protein